MNWDWMTEVLKGSQFGLAVLGASFLFGLASAATTASCGGIPAMLVIVGYTASQEGGKKQLILAVVSFLLTSVIILATLGALTSFVGGAAFAKTGAIGFYARKAVGLVALVLGLTALDLTPFHMPNIGIKTTKLPKGVLGAMMVGLSVGAATAACASACSPLQLPIVLGFAALRGKMWEGAVILGIFALGYAFPLVAVMLGLGLGKSAKFMEKLDRPLRLVSGIFMVGLAFYFMLLTK
jgi:cytochrome c biogenesis protein CcdA